MKRIVFSKIRSFLYLLLICFNFILIFAQPSIAITKEQNQDMSCDDCTFANETYSAIPQDTEQTCRPERMYLNHDLQLLKAQDVEHKYFTDRDDNDLVDAQFPKKCVHFAMKHFVVNIFSADTKPVANFATCSANQGVPQHTHWGPCITEDYVNLIYNSFMDITSCLDLPQRSILPKLMNESGFHINTFAPLRVMSAASGIKKEPLNYPWPTLNPGEHIIGGDAGIGQLTGPALADISENIGEWKDKIFRSDKPACKRITKFIKNNPELEQVKKDLPNRCSLIHAPENPMVSLIYYGVLFKTIERNINYKWKSDDVDGLLSKSGLSLTDAETQKVKEMLILLAYNAGASESLTFFENWLEARIDKAEDGESVTIEDLDFSVDLPKDKIEVLNKDGNVEAVALPSLSKVQVDALVNEYNDLISKESDESFSRDQENRLALLKKINFSKLVIHRISFPLYLRLYRTGNAKGYLSYLRGFSYLINKNIGSNVCTDDSFLTFR